MTIRGCSLGVLILPLSILISGCSIEINEGDHNRMIWNGISEDGDSDNDGKISLEEYASYWTGGKKIANPEEFLGDLDENNDGFIGKSEFFFYVRDN